jgi:catechol 2,3-dioxygenase-like lactoylglutathione lyase family enzyme
VLRSFDEARAKAFYCGFLGFTLGFQHRFAPDLPLYFEVERAGLVLHVSEHHGDATPGSTVFVRMQGIAAFHAELMARDCPNNRPGIETVAWGREMQVIDPFANRIRFCESD